MNPPWYDEPVHGRAHRVLAHAEVDVAAAVPPAAAGRALTRRRAARSGDSKSPSCFSHVYVDGSRSPEPPTSSGTRSARVACSTASDALRVAMPLSSAANCGSFASQPAGSSPRSARSISRPARELLRDTRRSAGSSRPARLAALERRAEVPQRLVGNVERRLLGPAEVPLRLLAPRRRRADCRAPRTCPPCRARRSRAPSRRRSATAGRRCPRAPAIAREIAATSLPSSTLLHVPAVALDSGRRRLR